jgi:hypothetical protein
MSFFSNLRADRLIAQIKSTNDLMGAETQKAIAKLKEIGAGSIEMIIAALPDADKHATVAFVDVLGTLATQKTFPQYIQALVQGSPRVIAGVAWALTSSRGYPPHLLLEALGTPRHRQVRIAGRHQCPTNPLLHSRAADGRLRPGAR